MMISWAAELSSGQHLNCIWVYYLTQAPSSLFQSNDDIWLKFHNLKLSTLNEF